MWIVRWTLAALLTATGFVGTGQAQQVRLLGVPTGSSASPAPVIDEADAGPLHLEVRLDQRRLYVYQGSTELRSFPVAVGKPEHPTPAGEFRIRRVIWNPSWVPPRAGWARGKKPKAPGDPDNPMGRVKLFFQEPDYYIHGTINPESLGEAASHGCIRMANEDVVELARLVMEHGGEPREPGWFQRVLNRVRQTREVRLAAPVPVRIRAGDTASD